MILSHCIYWNGWCYQHPQSYSSILLYRLEPWPMRGIFRWEHAQPPLGPAEERIWERFYEDFIKIKQKMKELLAARSGIWNSKDNFFFFFSRCFFFTNQKNITFFQLEHDSNQLELSWICWVLTAGIFEIFDIKCVTGYQNNIFCITFGEKYNVLAICDFFLDNPLPKSKQKQ